MRFLTVLVLLFVLNGFTKAQCDTSRYRIPVFSDVYKHADVKYGEAPVWNVPYNNTDLFMDIYEPIGDQQEKRPLMLWVHPGGFLLGDKSADDMVALCDSFARRGYVTASIGYRLGFNPLSSESSERAVYRGVQDVHAAIRYMYEFHDVYNIDTNYTFVGGSSAGSVATLHLAYLDQSEAPSSVYGNLVSPDLGNIESTGNAYSHTVELAGIVNLWGALGDSSYIEVDEVVPSLHIHGEADGVVPFGVGAPFGAPTLNPTHGSRAIHNQLDLLGIDHKFHPFAGQDHEFHGADNGTFNNPPNAYWDTIFNLIDKHYLELVLPESKPLSGDTILCVEGIGQYMVNLDGEDSPCWNVVGGQVVSGAGTESIDVLWDEQTVTGTVSCSIENELGAISEKSIMDVEFIELPEVREIEFLMSGNLALYNTVDGEEVTWDFGDGSTSFGSSVSHFYEESGIYDVSASFQNDFGCESKLDTTFFINLTEEVFMIYPNPADNILIVSQSYNELGQLSIFSLSGKRLLNQQIEDNETHLDVSQFASGVYLIYLENSKGTHFKKLIVH